MSDKRRRFRKPREDKQPQRTITIVRRNNDAEPTTSSQRNSEAEVVPKILLKPKASEKESKDDENIEAISSETSQRAETPNIRISASSGHLAKDLQASQEQNYEFVPKMTRPATILSSTGVVSTNVKRLLKENNDFYVVGVIGCQGVGKSTILNLLAYDKNDNDCYQKIFIDEDGYFPTKLKQNKNPSRSRTESIHLFVTSDRMILLDTAPVMCNSYKKDMTTNELDDLRSIVNFLTVCHLVIVVYKDYLNLNFLRLLRLAELMKPSNVSSSNTSSTDYFPNLLFIKNRAKRSDFSITAQKQMDEMLESFFKDSKMRIHRGQTAEQQLRLRKNNRSFDCELKVNNFVFPEVKNLDAMPYHKPISEIIDDLRWLVFTSPRNQITSGEFTELAWFDLFEKVTQTQHFFFNTYDHIHRNHFDSGSNVRDNQDNWKD